MILYKSSAPSSSCFLCRRPLSVLAIVIAFGLTFSTVITLVLVPVVYTIFDDMRNRIVNRFNKIFNRMKKIFIKEKIKPSEI